MLEVTLVLVRNTGSALSGLAATGLEAQLGRTGRWWGNRPGRSRCGPSEPGQRSTVLTVLRSGAGRTSRTVLPGTLATTLADLGPTFVKLGQVLSTRPDLVPPAFEAALATLQDSAPAVSFDAVSAAVLEELGATPETLFATFERIPLAAASIGQVHAARLWTGEEVVVKVRRPGVIDLVEADLGILGWLARLRLLRLGALGRVDLPGFVEEFATTIRGELDYVAEAANADRARPMLGALGVHVPLVHHELSSVAVLTLERIEGIKIDDLASLDAAGVDRRALASNFARAYLSMVFEHGFFHADPHPGNLFVEEGGRLAMVDFGMVGSVSDAVREALVEILLALVTHDMARDAAALRRLGIVPDGVDEAAFASELDRVTAASIDVPLGSLRVAPLLLDMMAVSRRHKLRFPRELPLLVKTVVMCEGLAAALDPSFALPVVLVTFVGRALPGAIATDPG